jgi:hypothetical protein
MEILGFFVGMGSQSVFEMLGEKKQPFLVLGM